MADKKNTPQSSRVGSMTNTGMFFAMLRGAIFRRSSRAIMAVIASLVGAATLFCLATVCIEVPQQMTEEMRAYGANLVVTSQNTGKTANGISSSLAKHLMKMVTAYGDEASYATYRYENVRINSAPYQMAGINVKQTSAINRHWSITGRWPKAENEVLIGSDVADALSVSVGQHITIGYAAGDSGAASSSSADSSSTSASSNSVSTILDTDGTRMHIVGIVSTGGSEDSIVYSTVGTLEKLTGRVSGSDIIEYSSSAEGSELTKLRNNINAMTSMNVSAQTVSKISSANASIISMLQVLFWIISVVVLALTLVGVSTTMSSIVEQRRTEIALRKALGASFGSIAQEFYAESAIYGFVGGILGVGVGYGVSVILTTTVFNQEISFNWWLALAGLVVSVVLAVLASLHPVHRASHIDPAIVLSEE